MNRLIIIGNGFDLAHGLKTSYKDFINDYFAYTVFPELEKNHTFEDKLLSVRIMNDQLRSLDPALYKTDPINIFKKQSAEFKWRVTYKNFLKSIFERVSNFRWVDIEVEYFNHLYKIIDTYRTKNSRNERISHTNFKASNGSISQLNKQLSYIETLLVNYLKKQNSLIKNYYNSPSNTKKQMEHAMFRTIQGNTIDYYNGDIVLLNFNYTNTIDLYSNLGEYNTMSIKTIDIHGRLDKNLIFGFGDDTTDNYRAIEDLNDNEFLKKIKSFKYSDTNSYSDLIHFISDDDFEVHIFGHSCGISDRTLLKQIFENKYCQRIIVHPYNKEDFDQKKYEISRHFSNNTDFLNKLIPFPKLEPMPQPMLFKDVEIEHSLNGIA